MAVLGGGIERSITLVVDALGKANFRGCRFFGGGIFAVADAVATDAVDLYQCFHTISTKSKSIHIYNPNTLEIESKKNEKSQCHYILHYVAHNKSQPNKNKNKRCACLSFE